VLTDKYEILIAYEKLGRKYHMTTFMKHRSQQDPDNVFVTPYMEKFLGIGNKLYA